MRHNNISSHIDGIDCSKAVHKAGLKVSAKIGEPKSKNDLEFVNAMCFDCDQELGEPHLGQCHQGVHLEAKYVLQMKL